MFSAQYKSQIVLNMIGYKQPTKITGIATFDKSDN